MNTHNPVFRGLRHATLARASRSWRLVLALAVMWSAWTAATVRADQLRFPPGLFDLGVSFGCDCTCFCTNSTATNGPVGAFLTANPIVGVVAADTLAPLGQWVPPHWTIFPVDYTIADTEPFFLEGWTTTQATAARRGTSLSYPNPTPLSTPFNFSTPISFLFPFEYYQGPLASIAGPGRLPVLSQTDSQPYPWNIEATLVLANGQSYHLEQQLAIGYWPLEGNDFGPPLDSYVDVVETNGLLEITLLCTNGLPIQTAGATIRATLLDDGNIPAARNTTAGGSFDMDLFQTWNWPLGPANTPLPTSGNNPRGAADTEQASLRLNASAQNPEPIEGQGLLVRAHRSYRITVDYTVVGYNAAGNPIPVSVPDVTFDTGVIQPCQRTNITLMGSYCTGQTNAPTPPPCYTSLTGEVNMLEDPTLGTVINVRAFDGPKGNSRDLDPPLPAPGSFVIDTLVASDAYSTPGKAYRLQANTSIGTEEDYEYFRSPVRTPVYAPCSNAFTSVSNDFVMCPANPGVVRGTVTLNGAVDPGYYGGVPALSTLRFANHLGGLPHDANGQLNLSLSRVSSIQATGGVSAVPPILTPAEGGGAATTSFDNNKLFLSPNTFRGDYALRMAGLQGQPSLWSPNRLHLVFDSPVNLDYTITELAPGFTNALIVCGETRTNNITHCFGLKTISIVNEFPWLQTYTHARLTISGTGPGGSYKVGPFTLADVPFQTTTSADNACLIPLFLPEGDYEYTADVKSQYGWLSLASTNFTITCPPLPCLQYTCPTNKTVFCGTPWNFDPPTNIVDNCCTNFSVAHTTVTNATACPRTITRHWTIFDGCTNLAGCSQVVTLIDTNPPAMSCPPAKSVVCGSDWSFDPPTILDDCGGTNVNVRFTTATSGECPLVLTRQWIADDGCGNTNTCSQTVTVWSHLPPTFACPANKTVECGSPWGFDTPGVSLGCAMVPPPAVVLSTTTNTLNACTQVITRVWAATNPCAASLQSGLLLLSVDFNSGTMVNESSPPGFQPFTVVQDASPPVVSQSYATLGPLTSGSTTIRLSSSVGNIDSRDRLNPPDSGMFTFGEMYRDFVTTSNDNRVLIIQISGLTPGQRYRLTFYSFDVNHQSRTDYFTNVTAGVQPSTVGAITTAGTPTFNSQYALNMDAVATAGVITFHERASGFDSPRLNGLQISAVLTASATCTQVVTVVDRRAPIITNCAPSLVVTNCEAPIPDFRTNVVAGDLCHPGALVVTQTPAPGTVVGPGTHPVGLTVCDPASNCVSCVAQFTVVDTEQPSGNADPVSNLRNTGVDASGQPLPSGALDQRFTLVSRPAGSVTTVARATDRFAGWLNPGPGSMWIGATNNDLPGAYVFSTFFTNDCASGGVIRGRWAADNEVVLFVNGTLRASRVGNSGFNFGTWAAFTVAGLAPGVYQADFVVTNRTFGPFGLLVEWTNYCPCPPFTNCLAPYVALQPTNVVLPYGVSSPSVQHPAVFTAVVGGTGPLSYQWCHNGVPLANGPHVQGANTATLTVTAQLASGPEILPTDNGVFSLKISNACAQVTTVNVTALGSLVTMGRDGPGGVGPTLRLSFSTDTDRFYDVFYRDSFGPASFWMPYVTVQGTGTNVVLPGLLATNQMRFFQVRPQQGQ